MMSEPTEPREPRGEVLRFTPKKKRALSDAHREHLRTSGLTDESIDAGGFYTERDRNEIAGLLNWRLWPRGRGDVLVIPFFLPGSSEPFFARVRPDQPRTNEKTGKVAKYEQPKEIPVAPYLPFRSRVRGWLEDTSRPLVLVEGEKKAALLDQLEYATVGAAGVSCFHDVDYRRETEAYRLHALIRQHVRVEGRKCLIAFDSDAADNDHVMRAARILAGMLAEGGASETLFVRIPHGEGGVKLGIDDFFMRHGETATRQLFVDAEPLAPLSGDDSHGLLRAYRVLAGLPVDERLRMPHGYDLDRNGALYYSEKDSELVERAPIFIRRLVADLYSGHEHVELTFRRNRAWRTALVPRRAIADGRAALGELAPLGAPVDSNTSAKVVKWFRDFESTNEKRLPRATSVARCGWHRVGDHDVFVLADPIAREGVSIDLVVDRQHDRGRLSRALHTMGEYEEHLAVLNAAWQASPIAATVIAAALAAPLLKPLGAPLFAVHLAGDSSRGKSTMLRIAASVFGNPRDDEWVTSWNSTSVGHEMRAGYLCDLPLAIDEAGVTDARDREKAVYMLVNGVGRTRGAKEGGLRETHSWRTVVLSTGERLLAEEASAATGAQVRILQLQVDGFGNLDATGVDALGRGVAEHYGHVGRQWLEALVEVSPDDWIAHKAALKARMKAFQTLAGGSTLRARQAGFWALLAHVEESAHETLGLGQPGGATMRELFERPGDSQLEVRSAADRAMDAVREWIVTHPTNFPKLTMSSSGQKVPKGESSAREVHGYIDDDELLIVPGALRGMLAERGIADSVVLREWRARGWIRVGENRESSERFSLQVRVGGKKPRMIIVCGDIVGLDVSGNDETGDIF